MASLQSSQNFVRALKAASDPPAPDGPYKIELARQAWDDTSFYVPSKAEVVVDWILTKLSKDKGKELSANPLVDLRYWALLSDVVSSRDTSITVVSSRPLKTWLTSLLNRVHIGPIVVTFLNIFDQLEHGVKAQLSTVVSSCLDVIWPLGVQKTSTELLLECWGTFLQTLTRNEAGPSIFRIGLLITSSYRSSLSNSSNKKKIYSAFVQNFLECWLYCVALDASTPSSHDTLFENIFNTGTETIFSLDNLRQSQDTNSDIILFESLQKLPETSKTVVLAVLPRLFIAYIQAIKKCRGTLFSQGSNQLPGAANDEFLAAGMRFFASCQPMLVESSKEAWTTRAALLTTLDQENLFQRQQLNVGIVLNENIDLALAVLATGWEVSQSDIIVLSVQCLIVIAQIDYDLILPAIPRILPRLLLIPDPKEDHFVFLNILLDYHTKTRTMSAYITNLLSALSPKHLTMIPGGAREAYRISLSAPLLHATHLERISKAISQFLTPSQCLPTVDSILASIDAAWEQQYSAERRREVTSNEGSRKKRKTEANSTETVQDPEILAVTFSLSARLAYIVLSSLPARSLPETMRSEVHERLLAFRDTILRDILNKCLKTIQKQGKSDGWSIQVAAASILRLKYALSVSKSVPLPQTEDIKVSGKLSDALHDDAILPELGVEIFRVLLHRASPANLSESQATIDKVLSYLEASFKTADISWSGQDFRLTFGEPGKAESALSLLHMVLERWLPVIDLVATPAQLERLIRIIMSIRTSSAAESSPIAHELRPQDLLMRTLRCAQFWELHNIRNVFLPYLIQTTSFIEKLGSSKIKPSQLTDTISAYRLILLFPIEYFSRASRAEFVKRALQADTYISRLQIGEQYTADFLCEALTILRVFLKRVFSHAGAVEQQSNQELVEFLEHLIVENRSVSLISTDFSLATLDLAELYFSELLKAAQKGTANGLLKALASFSQYPLFDGSQSMLSQAFAHMVALSTTAFSVTNLPEEVQTAMRNLHKDLTAAALPRMSAIGASKDGLLEGNELMTGWCCLLAFGRWLGFTDGGSVQFFGQSLTSRIVAAPMSNSAPWDNIRVTTLEMLLQELHYRIEDQRTRHLDLVVAAYIVFAQVVQQRQREQMDEHLSKTCRLLSPAHYAHILNLVAESLSSERSAGDRLVRLVHLSALLLREHPQSTLKPMQAFATKCIVAFSGRDNFTAGPISLRLQVLELVSQHCSERPAALRSVDMGSIWALLFQFLAPSHEHDAATTPEIYQKITAIISALIRLRRDLVTPTLPHLGMILRQLLLCTRGCRPHLGTKQTTMVTDTLPRWISSTHPIGVEEVKALSRLLETLDIKTLVRTHASGNEVQTAESLAKPFSKHAAYVLKAYIEAMNDPLCILPLELRKELKPGLFALCNIMSEHGRDAIMVSALDGGGKTTLKALWSEYEKQRYVGKG